MLKDDFFFRKKYKAELANYLGVSANQITLSAKGRVGLYGILKSLNIRKGDEVILPAFTCVVVPNAIIYLGAKPIYVDIDPLTFNMDIKKVEKAITTKTKIVLAQNTFGLASDNDALQAICNQHNLHLIEDCTHGFGGTYKGKKNGTIAEAAFYSSQWNKAFSTGFGGMTVCKNEELAQKLNVFEEYLLPPSPLSILSLKAQIFARKNLLVPSIYWSAIRLYRFLSKKGIVSGSSTGLELERPVLPDNFFIALSEMQAKIGIQEVQNIEKNKKHRKKVAKIYKAGFERMGFPPVFEPDYAEHTFIIYPFFVKDRTAFQLKAEKAKVPLNDWLNSPIHPIQEGFEKWHYNCGSCPIAEKIGACILNLPTDESIKEKDAHRFLRFLEKNREDLISL